MAEAGEQTEETLRPSLKELAEQLIADGKELADAELAHVRAQASVRSAIAVPALVMLLAGTALGAGTLVALLVGLVIWLAPLIGTGLAILAVSVGALVIAAILVKIGRARLATAFSFERTP